ncbi:MAG: prenyltransferase/squalene oxidase repeat-containing protein, partial [Planctomycetota bacterium]
NARKTLLAQRNAQGHWEGELSSSALSTATAVCALEAYVSNASNLDESRRELILDQVHRGRLWLIKNQNADGGWGDTTKSHSNISTTLLVWGALNTTDSNRSGLTEAEANAEAWIKRAAGSLDPTEISKAVRARYGKDQTFSVPILMALASRGRLGESETQSWRLVPQLPFELAVCPRSWFAALKLPVVSYALPALIAIGLVRHCKAPSRNPIARLVRSLATKRCLKVLESIQPQSGGFLEAIPLTSFVAIAMIGASQADHPTVSNGVSFLIESFRPDGSWAIDTHLATWVSTLSINALSQCRTYVPGHFSGEYSLVSDWVSDQQYQQVHPFTNAAPGGWSWTPLSGGVPDADDTPGAMLSLKVFWMNGTGGDAKRRKFVQQALAGAKWLMDLQNRDGGIPTFCKGWGTLPFDRSNPDITAHAIRAWLSWYDFAERRFQVRMRRSIEKAMMFLKERQRADGAWVPLWFGNQYVQDDENLTYGTSRVLLAWNEARKRDWLKGNAGLEIDRRISLAAQWLVGAQQSDGSWTGADRGSLRKDFLEVDPGQLGSIEETALAVETLSALCLDGFKLELDVDLFEVLARGVDWIEKRTKEGTEFSPSPIGFYFAKLWYYEKHYPICYSVAALERFSEL